MNINVTYACPNCHIANRADVSDNTAKLTCDSCQHEIAMPTGALDAGHVRRCLVCPSTDLFVRKDFPQRLGVAIVATGIIGSSIAWYFAAVYVTFAILFATALVDVLLYALVGDALMCYRCGAEYRRVDDLDQYGAFDLETHERHRQLVARTPRPQQQKA